jgi:hypothetical protein
VLLAVVFPATAAEPEAAPSRGDRMLDAYFRLQVKQIADACLADIKNKEDWLRKRPERHRQFLEMMGLWPLPKRTPLKPVVTGKLETDAFTVEKLHFQSLPGLYVSANLYLPKKAKFPAPAVLYVCGHAATIIDGISYGNKVAYQHHPAWLAEHGYVCLIVDTLQLGEIQGIHHGTYKRGMWWWHTLGYTPAGIECWNGIRALDYLETRKEVDPKRLAVTGRSGGGATSWWVAAADPRPQCIIPVAGIADLRAHVVEGATDRFRKGVISGHCDCMYFVNTYRWDFAMVAALCAPRPLLLGNSDADAIFPLEGYRRLARKAHRIYELYGAGDKFQLLETKGPHKDTPELRKGAFAWLNRWLKNDREPIVEKERKRFTPQELKVFDRIPEDAINATVHESFIRPARIDLPKSKEAAPQWWKEKREEWMQVLKEKVFHGWPEKPPPLNVRPAPEIEHKGLRLRAFDFTSEDGVELRLWVLTLSKGKPPTELICSVMDDGRWEGWCAELGRPFQQSFLVDKSPAQAKSRIEQWRADLEEARAAVAVIVPRGIGPTGWSGRGTPVDVQIRRRFALLGQTLDGQRVWDVRRSLAVLREVADLKQLPVRLRGDGEMAGIALYATIFERDVATLVPSRLPASHGQGPVLLNVRRYLDMPQALALALAKSTKLPVEDDDEAKAWEWPLRLQGLLGKESIKITKVRPRE